MKRNAIIAAVTAAALLGTAPCSFAAGLADNTTSTASTTVQENGSAATGSAIKAAPDVSSDTAAAGGHTAANAADSSVTETPVVTNLSLAEAIKIMQTTGTSAETAELNKKSDQAIARGYKETVQSIKDGLQRISDLQALIQNTPGGASTIDAVLNKQGTSIMGVYSSVEAAGATATNEKIMKLRRDFANEHIESNYQAEMNGIEYTTVQVYYGVLLAADNLKIAEDNLKTQQEILKNTETQYQVGMVAMKDVLAAKSAVETAKSDVQAAQTKLDNAKMSFNFLLGYPVMQKVNFTDKLTAIQGPEEKVEVYIKQALENRMELDGANFAKEVHGILLESLKYRYPSNSSTYLAQQVAYLNAAKVAKDAPNKIEIDIRTQYAGIQDAKAALESAKATQKYAQEGYRLVNLSYQAGMTTLAEVQSTQVLAYKANLGVAAATNAYDLAVYNFKYATGAGTTRLPF